jgi:hypothetical protein
MSLGCGKMQTYLESLIKIEKKDKYEKEELMIEELLMERAGKLEVYYAPFDYINRNAKVMILGITPGWTQMHNALAYTIQHLEEEPFDQCLINAKRHASFSGPIRKNLISMLDDIGMNHYLGVETCSQLYEDAFHLIHSTSILRYPVFIDKRNYTGSQPKMMKNPVLKEMVIEQFVKELNELNDELLIIPMGKAVSEALSELKVMGYLTKQTILDHFPHPSGANGSRKKQFEENKARFIKIIRSLKE